MVFLFYNKWLLRLLALLAGAGVGLCAVRYIALSVEKLPEQGLRDALAIVSFLIAGWLVMVLAEVVDNHYMRALGCLCAMFGGYASFKWIFAVDGPKLLELPDGPALMSQVRLGYWGAMVCALVMLSLLVTRLILDKANAGRPAYSPAQGSLPIGRMLGGVAPDAGISSAAPTAPASRALPPIPVDLSPLAVSGHTSAVAQPALVPRVPAPVARLQGIGGVYLGTTFVLAGGENRIGRADAPLLLANDSQVSRAHASISLDAAGLATLSDLGSTNGTFLNNERVSSALLVPGDVIRIGTTLFRVDA
jgi:FHA domain